MQRWWNWTLENLDTVLAMLLSIIAAVYGVFGGGSPLLAAIAGALGLLAYGTIKDRVARVELQKAIQQLRSKPSAGMFLRDRNSYISFNSQIDAAQSVYLVGPSLVNLFSQWSDYFKNTKLNTQGAKIRAIILDPDSAAVESTAVCLKDNTESIRNEITTTILRVRSILQDSGGITKGEMELRLMKAHPNYSMVLIDPEKSNGKIILEFIGYQASLHTRPHIELTPEVDKEWYYFFLSQYESIYRDSQALLSN